MELIHAIGGFISPHHNLVMPIAVHTSPVFEAGRNLINASSQTIFIPSMRLPLLWF
jgi:hypothetical protein